MVEVSIESYTAMVEVSVESSSAMVEVSVGYNNYYSVLHSNIEVIRYTGTSSICVV